MGTRDALGPTGAVITGALTLPPTLDHNNQERLGYSDDTVQSQCNNHKITFKAPV